MSAPHYHPAAGPYSLAPSLRELHDRTARPPNDGEPYCTLCGTVAVGANACVRTAYLHHDGLCMVCAVKRALARLYSVDVYQLRRRVGLTQDAFASLLWVSKRTVMRWEDAGEQSGPSALLLWSLDIASTLGLRPETVTPIERGFAFWLDVFSVANIAALALQSPEVDTVIRQAVHSMLVLDGDRGVRLAVASDSSAAAGEFELVNREPAELRPEPEPEPEPPARATVRRKCPKCGRSIKLDGEGRFAEHYVTMANRRTCSATGHTPSNARKLRLVRELMAVRGVLDHHHAEAGFSGKRKKKQ